MKEICKAVIVTALILAGSFYAKGEQFEYRKGPTVFSIVETASEYRVTCTVSGSSMLSRNRNITDRQNRITAVDLIGAYIVFTSSEQYSSLGSEYFQFVVDGIDLHYNAVVEGLQQKTQQVDGKQAQEYICKKDKYRIGYASYKKDLDLYSLVVNGYNKDKCERTARLLYNFRGFTAEQHLAMERDFLSGDTQLPSGVRSLQAVPDRFELSVYAPEQGVAMKTKQVSGECPETKPYSQFYYEEIVTSVSLSDKPEFYSLWRQPLSETGTIYESMLEFCARKCSTDKINRDEATFSKVIETFPGAISPFGIRQPITDSLYNKAAAAYSESDFEKAAGLLRQSIDSEGISAETLNLLGASYRYLGRPEKAMPYLLLCLKLAPHTKFLAGNIAICMSEMGFRRMDDLSRFLLGYAVEEWSKEEINKLLTIN